MNVEAVTDGCEALLPVVVSRQSWIASRREELAAQYSDTKTESWPINKQWWHEPLSPDFLTEHINRQLPKFRGGDMQPNAR